MALAWSRGTNNPPPSRQAMPAPLWGSTRSGHTVSGRTICHVRGCSAGALQLLSACLQAGMPRGIRALWLVESGHSGSWNSGTPARSESRVRAQLGATVILGPGSVCPQSQKSPTAAVTMGGPGQIVAGLAGRTVRGGCPVHAPRGGRTPCVPSSSGPVRSDPQPRARPLWTVRRASEQSPAPPKAFVERTFLARRPPEKVAQG
mmetsp:Transcript_121564/g.211209  ORF Transcript_121564/g.211209 Transcript_121564/m.211209 type:complete len:204 (-) Transcript_121564:471-1082(-)